MAGELNPREFTEPTQDYYERAATSTPNDEAEVLGEELDDEWLAGFNRAFPSVNEWRNGLLIGAGIGRAMYGK